jgi:TonB family protein
MKSLVLVLALLGAPALVVAGGEKPRVFGFNPAPASGWKFDQGSIPKYPGALIRERIEGDVLLAVRISPAGHIDVVESARGEPALVAAVRAAASSWSFRPAAKDTRPNTAHVPIGISFRLDLEPGELFERAQSLTIERRGVGDSVLARLEAVTPAERTNVARALTQKGFLKQAGKDIGPPKNANWHMTWHTQGRIVEVSYSETKHAVMVSDETRRWSGSHAQSATALQDVLNRLLPPQ